jgi:hypothetical protein
LYIRKSGTSGINQLAIRHNAIYKTGEVVFSCMLFIQPVNERLGGFDLFHPVAVGKKGRLVMCLGKGGPEKKQAYTSGGHFHHTAELSTQINEITTA